MTVATPMDPIRIVIVDDHPNTASMLARVLMKVDSPVEVITASGAEEALHRIGDQGVDILITDFMMPGINGLEFIEMLSAEKKPEHVILITAYDTPGLAVSAKRLQVKDYLVKPVQPDKIREVVKKAIAELRPPPPKSLGSQFDRSCKILVADDNPDHLRLLSTRLKDGGYQFIPAWDGEDALKKAREDPPDLILLDINMPKKDGFQVLEEIRSDPSTAHIPVIVITAARIGPKDMRDGLVLGADDYVIKPFDWRELAARIQSKLRVKLAEDLLRQKNQALGVLPKIGSVLKEKRSVQELANSVTLVLRDELKICSARIDIFMKDGTAFCSDQNVNGSRINGSKSGAEAINLPNFVKEVTSTRHYLWVEDASQDTKWQHFAEPGVVSLVSLPLIGMKGFWGVLSIFDNKPTPFTVEFLNILEAVALFATLALENIQ